MSAARAPAGEAMASRDLLAALAVVVIWGLNFVVMKWGLRYFTPFQLGAVRYVFAALPLVFFLKPPRMHWRWVLRFGLFQGVGQFGFGFFALKLGMAIAAAGLVCFAMNFIGPGAKGTGVGGATLVGICLTLCAASCWAVSNIVSRLAQQESPGYNPLSFVAWSSLVPVLPFLALTAVTDADAGRWLHADAWAALPPIAWAAAAYLGWVATIVGYGLWTSLLTRYPANRVAPFSLGVPVVGLAAGLLALGEVVTAWQWAGAACVVMALVCVVPGPRWSRRRSPPRTPSGP
ncbi:EamA family transporter [Acidovorax sp. SUPP3334]|uniref:EamA family transporter n=1 Tax=Acidovorax sp. SUPP3334 TaxID=2920881 RepID=UPI0023DE50A5|nr:EamA family transporter [Acidovorax sp. SUPP3334]GKT24970.1 EamA family transporter [Acidovorax sp. SUPP3334]